MATVAPARLTLDDIADLRAYERERPDLLARIADLKAKRRVAVGPIVTLVFENRETVRFQVQEMARAERLISDDAVQADLDAYNPLIPGPGQLSATMFIELTSGALLREWLPKLVGVEREVALSFPDGSAARAVTEARRAAQLTRDDVTSTVHYLCFELTEPQVTALGRGEVVRLGVTHRAYRESVALPATTVSELARDTAP